MVKLNWRLGGALGYEVPGDIPPGDFKCGLCEAKSREVTSLNVLLDNAYRDHEKTIEKFEKKRQRRNAKKAAADTAADQAAV